MSSASRLSGTPEQPPQKYDFSKIDVSDKFAGRHVRVSPSGTVKIDSSFGKAIRQFVAERFDLAKPNYVKDKEAIQVLNQASNIVSDSDKSSLLKLAKAQTKVATILSEKMAMKPLDTEAKEKLTYGAKERLEWAHDQLLDKLTDKNPVLETLTNTLKGSTEKQLDTLRKEYGVNLKTGDIDPEKFSSKLVNDICANRPGIDREALKEEIGNKLQNAIQAVGLRKSSGLVDQKTLDKSIQELFSPESHSAVKRNNLTKDQLEILKTPKTPEERQSAAEKLAGAFEKTNSPDTKQFILKGLVAAAKSDPETMKMLVNEKSPIGAIFVENSRNAITTEYPNFIKAYVNLSQNASIGDYDAIGKEFIYQKSEQTVNTNSANRTGFEAAVKSKDTEAAKKALDAVKNELFDILSLDIKYVPPPKERPATSGEQASSTGAKQMSVEEFEGIFGEKEDIVNLKPQDPNKKKLDLGELQ